MKSRALLLAILIAALLGGTGPARGADTRPRVVILDPPEGAHITEAVLGLRLEVTVPDGAPIRAIPLWINGKPSAGGRDLLIERPAPDGESSAHRQQVLRLPIPAGPVTVEVAVETATARSARAEVHVVRAGRLASAPRLFLLAVGISHYQDPQLALGFAAKDAHDVAHAFLMQRGKAFRDVVVRVLRDGNATRSAVLEGLSWLQRSTEEEDLAVLFLAGHGVEDPLTGRGYYFLPADAGAQTPPAALLSGYDLQTALDAIAGQTLVLLDTCHAGGALGAGRGLSAAAPDRLGEQLKESSRITMIAASKRYQVSRESPEWGNGAFTKGLIEGLSGKADSKRDGRVLGSELEGYLVDRVDQLTVHNQTPTVFKQNAGDLVLALVPPPVYRRPWFWGALGALAAEVITSAVLLSLYPPDPPGTRQLTPGLAVH